MSGRPPSQRAEEGGLEEGASTSSGALRHHVTLLTPGGRFEVDAKLLAPPEDEKEEEKRKKKQTRQWLDHVPQLPQLPQLARRRTPHKPAGVDRSPSPSKLPAKVAESAVAAPAGEGEAANEPPPPLQALEA